VPHHAKAGNLNNCILKAGSTGQLIIILDCDMLPEPCMARTVAPFFYKKLSTVADVAADMAASTATPVLSAAASPAKRNPSQIEGDIAPAAGTAAGISVASAAAAAVDAAATAAGNAKRTAEFDMSVGLLQTPQTFYNLS
jgi:hypothetical protein